MVEKLRADAKRSRARLVKIEEEAGKVKFPIKDEVLMTMVSQSVPRTKGKSSSSSSGSGSGETSAQAGLEPLKTIPAAVLQLGTMLPEHLVNEAIGVWDFLNVFR